MKRILIHAGMPKCGSSTLQSILSTEKFHTSNPEILYVSIDGNGNLLYGKKLFDVSKKSPYQYSSSADIERLLELGVEIKIKIKNEIEDLLEMYDTIIISNEAWGVKPAKVNEFFLPIFSNNTKYIVDVLVYIRPQVDWLNSAWWQWGAWTDHSLDFWIEHNFTQANWLKHIEEWERLPWTNHIGVRLLNANLIQDFLYAIHAKKENYERSNKSSPASLLRFFQKNREFRKGAHDSSKEFILLKWLPFNDAKTPWVLHSSLIKLILKNYTEDNIKLLQYLDEQTKMEFKRNLKWSSELAYKDKYVEDYLCDELSNDVLNELIISSKKAISNLKSVGNMGHDEFYNRLNSCEDDNEIIKLYFNFIIDSDKKIRSKIQYVD